jgi:glycosyltransferase involved in cell wall biosynthesis
MEKLIIFIPAYNAERTVCTVIDRIPAAMKDRASDILVIDNHSPDRTYQKLLDYKKKKKMVKLTVLQNKKNIFFGGNLKAGMDYAVQHDMGIMAVLHSDLQYPPDMIDKLIAPIEQGKAQTTFGSRFIGDPLKGGMPFWRYAGNVFLTWCENVLIDRRFSEWHSGYCAYDVHALRTIPYRECENGYQLTTDILLIYIANRYKVAEIPIPTHYGKESTSPSVMRTFLYFVHSLRLAFVFFLHRIGVIRVKKYIPRKRASNKY